MDQPISVIIPAYNEEETVKEVVLGIAQVLQESVYEIIVVNDGSTDSTKHNAVEAGARVVSHTAKRGYGASLKTGIRHSNHELIVTIDADGQHNPADILRLVNKWYDGFDMVVGARDAESFQYMSRMPGKKFLQWMAKFLVGESPEDVNSGLRIFKKSDALTYFPILPNAFSFSTTITLAMLKDAFRVGWVSIKTTPRKGRDSNVSFWKDGGRTIMLIIRITTLFNPLKMFLPVSLGSFGIGFCYAVYNLLFREFNIPDGAEFLMTIGIIVFFFGIMADQFSSIRRS